MRTLIGMLIGATIIALAAPATAQLPSGMSLAPNGPPSGVRRFRAWPRSDGDQVNVQWFPSPNGNESIAVITGGINVVVDGVEEFGAIDLSTDRLVIWTGGLDQLGLGGESFQNPDTPLELYMEGNIEFRQGDRVVYAAAMHYDVRQNTGTVLNAEMLTPVPEYEGKLRVQAEQLRQIAKDRFSATNAKFTTSRVGEPGYWLQAGNMYFEDRQSSVVDPRTGLPQIDPQTNQPVVQHERTLTGQRNAVYVEGLPVFYWPKWTTDMDYPSFFLKRIRFGDDNVFGTQILTDWNGYELFGAGKGLPGTDWDLSLDYLSKRGPAAGTTFTYEQNPLPFLPSDGRGLFDAWFIRDTGLDNLGGNLRALPPETKNRGRALWRHRGQLGNGYWLQGEFGWISDRNFLDQYFKREWETQPDQLTRLRLERLNENRTWSIEAGARINDFFTQTEWLPRGDHYWLGQSLLLDRLTWFEHTNVGYARQRTASAPQNPQQAAEFTPMAWEVPQSGERFATRHELDLPFNVGPVRVVPYLLGEAAHWGSDLAGNSVQRFYGQAGIRTNLSMWRIDPTTTSRIFNLNGVAHKVDFEAELAYTDASQNFDIFPLYDPIDDDSIEAFRRQYPSFIFGGMPIPAPFDERYYAIREGMAGWVASPSTELVEDLTVVRLDMHNRWQTKRGAPGCQRTVDWMTLDAGAVIFPREEENFGEVLGLIDFDYRWHLGDRFSVLSSGVFDLFDSGQKLINIGVSCNRPERGNLYLGYYSLHGPIDSDVAVASLAYRLGPKYIVAYGGSLQLGGEANVVQRLTLTRIGESFLVRAGLNYNRSQDDVGFSLAIQPRLFRRTGRNLVEGIHVPPAGAFGLE